MRKDGKKCFFWRHVDLRIIHDIYFVEEHEITIKTFRDAREASWAKRRWGGGQERRSETDFF